MRIDRYTFREGCHLLRWLDSHPTGNSCRNSLTVGNRIDSRLSDQDHRYAAHRRNRMAWHEWEFLWKRFDLFSTKGNQWWDHTRGFTLRTPCLLPVEFQLFLFGQGFFDVIMNPVKEADPVLLIIADERSLPLYCHVLNSCALQKIGHSWWIAEWIVRPATLNSHIAWRYEKWWATIIQSQFWPRLLAINWCPSISWSNMAK